MHLFQESCYLWDKENIEAFRKGDSLLVIVKTPAPAADTAASATVEVSVMCNMKYVFLKRHQKTSVE